MMDLVLSLLAECHVLLCWLRLTLGGLCLLFSHHSLARLYVCDHLDRDVGRAGSFVRPVRVDGGDYRGGIRQDFETFSAQKGPGSVP